MPTSWPTKLYGPQMFLSYSCFSASCSEEFMLCIFGSSSACNFSSNEKSRNGRRKRRRRCWSWEGKTAPKQQILANATCGWQKSWAKPQKQKLFQKVNESASTNNNNNNDDKIMRNLIWLFRYCCCCCCCCLLGSNSCTFLFSFSAVLSHSHSLYLCLLLLLLFLLLLVVALPAGKCCQLHCIL